MKKTVLFLIISTIFSFQVISQTKVGFFMAVSDSSDTATISLTQDLYFQKLSLLPNVMASDFRDKKFDMSNIAEYSDVDYIFYPEIQENGTGWKCVFHAVNTQTKQEHSATTNYDSYYMILMDAKKEVTAFVDELKNNSLSSTSASQIASNNNSSISNVSIESLSGTWKGEEFIDKIVILRGGRGFVIYDNGASMNISLKVEDGKLIATQISMSNASYFPEISREKALELAPSANPIKWNLNIKNSKELEGTKYTLTEKNSSSPTYSQISVKWTKQ
jgi:hypothetical protein